MIENTIKYLCYYFPKWWSAANGSLARLSLLNIYSQILEKVQKCGTDAEAVETGPTKSVLAVIVQILTFVHFVWIPKVWIFYFPLIISCFISVLFEFVFILICFTNSSIVLIIIIT